MNWSADEVAEDPPGVVMVMSAIPATPGGEVTAQVVVAPQTTVGADVVPNVAVVEDEPMTNPVPVTVTTVPPATGPAPGVTVVTVGSGS